VGVLAAREQEMAYALEGVEFQSYGSAKNPAEIARNLFEALRRFDDLEVELIYAEGIDESGVGRAVMNRLKKAAGYRLIEV
jgi:L-threonylcarbamoyladenylate synthase